MRRAKAPKTSRAAITYTRPLCVDKKLDSSGLIGIAVSLGRPAHSPLGLGLGTEGASARATAPR